MRSIKKTLSPFTGKILLIVGALVLAIAVYGITAYSMKLWPFAASPLQQPSTQPTPTEILQQQAADSETKQNLIENSSPAKTGNTNTSSTGTATTQSNVIVTAQQDESGSSVTVFTKLYGYSDGSCTLTVSNGSRTSSQAADVIYQPEYSTCAGFNVPVAGNGTGTWSLNLTITSNGQSVNKQLSVEVK